MTNKPLEYYIDSSFPCLWEDIIPEDKSFPAFTISANEPEESCEEEHFDDCILCHWFNINIIEPRVTKEHAIALIKKYANIDVKIIENNLLITV